MRNATNFYVAGIVVESVGIAFLLAALIDGIGKNPGTILALLGGFLLICGGFLFNKMRRR